MSSYRVLLAYSFALALLAAASTPPHAGGLPIVDDFESGLPAGTDGDGVGIGFITFAGGGSFVAISTAATPPAPVLPAVGTPNNVLQVDADASAFAGLVHFFANPTLDTWVPQNWSGYEGFRFWIYGQNSGTDLFIDIIENRFPGSTTDDAERWSVTFTDDFTGWQLMEYPFSSFNRKNIGNGAPNDGLTLETVHGWAFGTLNTGGPLTYYLDEVSLYGVGVPADLTVRFGLQNTYLDEGTTGDVVVSLNRPMVAEDPAQVSVDYTTEAPPSIATAGRDYIPTSGTLTFVTGGSSELSFSIETLDDTKFEGDERIALRLQNPVDVELGDNSQASGTVRDNDPFEPNLLDDFERGAFLWSENGGLVLEAREIAAGDVDARPGQDEYERVLVVSEAPTGRGTSGSTTEFGRDFALGQDWSGAEALRFWFYGSGSGNEIGVTLKDNRAPDPGPAGWSLVWSDEFNETAGTPPDATKWSLDIGDVSPDAKNGWGNDERQYYTDDPANAATDGNGSMKLTVREADGSLLCFYGPCEYTSAQLSSKNKAEFAYGAIEARVLLPQGGGIRAAFRSLGINPELIPFPGNGSITNLDFVGRLPNEIFSLIEGPGYTGGGAFGSIYDFATPAYNEFHTITVEWQPDLIKWYIDGINFHTAVPADVPGPWVFNSPGFFQLNVPIGGNFGGAIDPDIMLPQSMLIDYVRVFQAPDTAERFETGFIDSVAGWREVVIPLTAFTRSAQQPAGAPDDGLGLTDVWGYGFAVSDTVRAQLDPLRLDLVRLEAELDTDADGVPDEFDNCILFANPLQVDSNGDNIGNVCDADIAGPAGGGFDDCTVNFFDLGRMKAVFFSNDPDADLIGLGGTEPDGVVNFSDLGRMKQLFFAPPGPSAAGCN